MARSRRSKPQPRKRTPDQRRRITIVWASFVGAVTLVSGVLAFDDASKTGFAATSLGTISDQGGLDPILDTQQPLQRERWTEIVIHHSGAPAGDAESIARQHVSRGYQGLGYHFLIGNGNGLGDGVVHVGYRWIDQLPGVQTTGKNAQTHNQHAIGVCLIGNGDRQPFSEAQTTELFSLVRRLQREFQIPAASVRLQRELGPGGITSPGRLFPAAQLQEQLLR